MRLAVLAALTMLTLGPAGAQASARHEGADETLPEGTLFRFQLSPACGDLEAGDRGEGTAPGCGPAPENRMRPLLDQVRRAAERGSAYDQFVLGFAYWMGRRAPRDLALAHMWLNLAAAGGHAMAAWSLRTLAQEMSPDERLRAERLLLDWRARHRAAE